MKLISLNAWCGTKYEALKVFLEKRSQDTDVFCFQEMRYGAYPKPHQEGEERTNLFSDLEAILSDFTGYYTEMVPGVGLATFIRSNIAVDKIEKRIILTAPELNHLKMPNGDHYYPRLMQSVRLKDRALVIHNFHGVPGNMKKDTPERVLQTDRLLEVLNQTQEAQILVGDFNLDMNTEAVAALSAKLRNLVKEGGFQTTRNSFYDKHQAIPYADYTFISQELEVQSFAVLPDAISDHLAMYLDFK